MLLAVRGQIGVVIRGMEVRFSFSSDTFVMSNYKTKLWPLAGKLL